MLLNLMFPTIYKPMRIMGITRHDTEMHGNNRLPPIDRMTVSPAMYCVRAKDAR